MKRFLKQEYDDQHPDQHELDDHDDQEEVV